MNLYSIFSGWLSRKSRQTSSKIPNDEVLLPNFGPLLRQMAQAFNLSELRTLCFDLQVDYEDLAGESATKSEKIGALIIALYHQNRLPLLLDMLAELRPHIVWHKPIIPTLRDQRNRANLLQNVQTTWIDGYLKHSLHTAVLLELNLVYQPQALSRTLLEPGQADQPIAVDKPLREVFEGYGRSLLILGEPGGGKTFTLLQLAAELIEQAKDDPAQPIPVVLNLSSWAHQRLPFTEWLVDEIFLQYQVARKLTRTWITENQLLYLLDGLDEVAEAWRDECVSAINSFKAEHPAELVVCSRITDYERLKNRLNLSVAIQIQPLSDAEIQRYLSQEGLALQAVRATLKHDPDLVELTHSPLTLDIITLAYQGLSLNDLKPMGSVNARRHHLFQTYVKRMFARRPLSENSFYDKNRALFWLINLATGMHQHAQSIFYIERLQPTWLLSTKNRRYHTMVGLIVGLISGLIGGLVSTPSVGISAFTLSGGLDFGLIDLISLLFISPIEGLIIGLILGLIGSPSIALGCFLSASVKNKKHRFFIGGFSSVASSILICILPWFVFKPDNIFILLSLMIALSTGWLIFGPIGGYAAYKTDINTIETISFSWSLLKRILTSTKQSFIVWFILGLSSAFIWGVMLWDISASLYEWVNWLFTGICLGLIFLGLMAGLIPGPLVVLVALLTNLSSLVQVGEIEQKLNPNQGVHNSLKNALLAGIFVVAVTGCAATVNMVISILLILGLGIIVLAFLYFGGLAVIQHYTLRFFLFRNHQLPRRLDLFLDDMAERILLRRVGGGWVFIHRYLLEYFAALHPKAGEKEDLTLESTNRYIWNMPS